jgi:hypothetical protein
MGMPSSIAIVDTMISFPHEGFGPFKDEVWPKFLSENARRVLKIGK